jgi:hypothetical protein
LGTPLEGTEVIPDLSHLRCGVLHSASEVLEEEGKEAQLEQRAFDSMPLH